MRTAIPMAVTFFLGIFMILEFFIPAGSVRTAVSLFQEWGLVLASAAFVLGAINVIQVNIPKIRRREPDWEYKVVLLIAALAMAFVGLLGGREKHTTSVDSTLFELSQAYSREAFEFLYLHVFAPANSTMFSLLAFFIASAAFRAFRARNLEASLMLITAVVVMLGVIPVGEWLWSGMPELTDWILNYANNAGRRAILVGAALGGVATGLRVILGLERSHLGGERH
ncbi:MAG: hypothetical protein AAF355_04825 [Myxococcota bacterium]